jgi:hypothetical protein
MSKVKVFLEVARYRKIQRDAASAVRAELAAFRSNVGGKTAATRLKPVDWRDAHICPVVARSHWL